jgi:hypothetical protein
MIRELIAGQEKKEGFSQSTIRNLMAPVRGMFFQAIDDGPHTKTRRRESEN